MDAEMRLRLLTLAGANALALQAVIEQRSWAILSTLAAQIAEELVRNGAVKRRGSSLVTSDEQADDLAAMIARLVIQHWPSRLGPTPAPGERARIDRLSRQLIASCAAGSPGAS